MALLRKLAEIGRRRGRGERGQPIFVGEAEPAAELSRLTRPARPRRRLPSRSYNRPSHWRQADRADVAGPARGVGSTCRRGWQRHRGDRDRRGAEVGDPLRDGEQIAVVDRDDQLEPQARGVGPATGDGLAGRERRRAGGPDGVGVGGGDAVAGPAEAGEIGGRGACRRQQRTGGDFRRDRLALAQQDQVVDPRALEVDRAADRLACDRTRGVSAMTAARARIACGALARGRRRLRHGLDLAVLDRLVCGPRSGTSGRTSRLQPISTRALSTIASSMLRLSFTVRSSSERQGTGSRPCPPHG